MFESRDSLIRRSHRFFCCLADGGRKICTVSVQEVLVAWDAQDVAIAAFNNATTAEELDVAYKACRVLGVSRVCLNRWPTMMDLADAYQQRKEALDQPTRLKVVRTPR
jgi:hypothetical protein